MTRPPYLPPTRDERRELVANAEAILYELMLAEPPGNRGARAEILEQATAFLALVRRRLLLTAEERD